MKLFAELQRRNVFRVAIAYVVAAWLLLQITEILQGLLELPGVVGKTVIFVLAAGFIPALVLAWIFELTPDGLKRETEVDPDASITDRTGSRLNIVIIAMLIVIAGYFAWESRFSEHPAAEPTARSEPVFTNSRVAVAAQAAEQTSIAVLPFLSIGANEQNAYFADGLSEEILNRLAQVPQLRVISRSSSFAFRDRSGDLDEVTDKPDVTHVLEGSVRRQGDQVRVTAQLVAAGSSTQMWSQTFDRRIDDVFAIQDEISQRVVDALDIVLDEQSRAAMLAAGVRNVDAFIAYQRGYQMVIDAHNLTGDALGEGLLEAEPFLDAAIDAAPDFAAAYIAKSDRYAHLLLDFDIPVEERMEARDTLLALVVAARDSAKDEKRRVAIEVDRIMFSDDWSTLQPTLAKLFALEGCAAGNWMELMAPFADRQKLVEYFSEQIVCDPLTTLSHWLKASLIVDEQGYEAAIRIRTR